MAGHPVVPVNDNFSRRDSGSKKGQEQANANLPPSLQHSSLGEFLEI